IDTATDPTLDIHLILDNYGTHKHPQVKRWFSAHPRYHVHFTPTSADRKSTRLNSSHGSISYAVFCLKKKNEAGDLDSPRIAGMGGNQEHEGQNGNKKETLNDQTENMESVKIMKKVYMNTNERQTRVI